MTSNERFQTDAGRTDRTPLPATAEFDLVAERTWQVTLCDGDVANIILDLQQTETLKPEIRVYPEPHVSGNGEPTVIRLSECRCSSRLDPSVGQTMTDEHGDPNAFSITLPFEDDWKNIISVDVRNRVPHVTVSVPDDVLAVDSPACGYNGFIIHTTAVEQHIRE